MFRKYNSYRIRDFAQQNDARRASSGIDYLRSDFSFVEQEDVYYSATIRVEDAEGNEKWIPIKKVSANELPEGVLGMTNHKEIFVRNDLDQVWTKKVIEHEKAHIRHPDFCEESIRELTNTREPLKFYKKF